HQKVRGMPIGDPTSRGTAIVQLEPSRLIPVLQHTRVMPHDVDSTQLGVALKLDGPAHFATGIATVNIPRPPATRRTGGEQGANGIGESTSIEPAERGIIIKHSGLPEKTTRTDVISALLILYEIEAEIERSRRKKRP